jgi:hypothetical protein
MFGLAQYSKAVQGGCWRPMRVERAFRDWVATVDATWRWDKTTEDRLNQPRSGGGELSPGRKPRVKWENNRAA